MPENPLKFMNHSSNV